MCVGGVSLEGGPEGGGRILSQCSLLLLTPTILPTPDVSAQNLHFIHLRLQPDRC